MTKYNKPRVTTSKKACVCDETGNNIRKFEEVLVVKEDGIKVFCKDSNRYKERLPLQPDGPELLRRGHL